MAENVEAARRFVWDNLRDCQVVFLATVQDGCPRVRPLTLMRRGDALFTVSEIESAKVNQIRENCNVEFAFSVPDLGFNAIRVECKAEVVDDARIRAEVYDSPGHALIRLTPTKFTVLMPPEFKNLALSPN